MADEEEIELAYVDYFNIDDIIAEQELLPVSFQTDVHFVDAFYSSHLPIFVSNSQSQQLDSQSSQSQQLSQELFGGTDEERTDSQQQQQQQTALNRIKKNTRMEIPLWLGIVLAERGHVSIIPPKCFKALSQLEAEPTTCNVRGLNKYFFIFGAQVAELLSVAGLSQQNRELGEKMGSSLTIAFKKRFLKILLESQDAMSKKANYSEVTKRLTTTELLIFEAGREGVEEFYSYKQTSGYENLNSSSKASLWDMSSSSDSFNARDFFNRTKQLEEEHLEHEERHRKRALMSDGSVNGTF